MAVTQLSLIPVRGGSKGPKSAFPPQFGIHTALGHPHHEVDNDHYMIFDAENKMTRYELLILISSLEEVWLLIVGA